MGFFSDEPRTSITVYIENLSNYEEIEWYQFEQLVESITMQPGGGREAIEAIRKKLKHGTTQQQLRVLEVLKLLMENSNQQFQRELISNDKMKDRFELIIESSAEDIRVRKTLVMLLGTWSARFKGEQGIYTLQQLHERGLSLFHGGKQRHASAATPPSTSPIVESSLHQRKNPPPPVRNPPTNHSQSYRDVPPPNDIGGPRRQHATTTSTSSSSVGQFDFEKEKPKIIQEVALATQSANNLINALRLINTSKDNWEIDMRTDEAIQEFCHRCEEEKRKIVKYARLVEDEEWIGTLLNANEELLKALDMYDIMLTGQIPSDFPTSPYRNKNSPPLALLGNDDLPRGEDGQVLEDPFADPVDDL